MNWLIDIFTEQTFIQGVVILSLICATGLALGNIKIFGISLGVTFVFFAGIMAGHLGLQINQDMLSIMQNFGLILFIYSLGVQVGPSFFSSFKKGGVKLNLLALSVLVLGTLMALVLSWTTNLSINELMGLLSGAATNTPMLGAAQQAHLQIHPGDIEGANEMAMACAVGYPIGIIGVILCIIVLRAVFGRKKSRPEHNQSTGDTFVAEYQVSNPGIFGKSIKEVMQNTDKHFVISRIWRGGKVIIPTSDTLVEENEHVLVISNKKDVESIKQLFGHKEDVDWNKQDIDWNSIDSQLVSRHILVTKPGLNGVKLGSLKLRNSYGINITRVNRAGIDLLASPSLRLQLGDRLTVVGESKAIDNVGKILGNEAKMLNNPNLFMIFIGIVLGLVLGSIPIAVPGISVPVKLGIAGGPIIVGILMGAFGPRIHLSTYTTRSANLMVRQIGIVMYLACLGYGAGHGFIDTVFCLNGLVWILVSLFIATVPVLVCGFIQSRLGKNDYAQTAGTLCAAMANPMALSYVNSNSDEEEASEAYATVYPLAMFIRVISAQLIMLLFA